jgi:hypothetical protein
VSALRFEVIRQLGQNDGLTGRNDSRKVVSRHRTREASERAASKLRRDIGEGWSVWAQHPYDPRCGCDACYAGNL